jgi:UDP-glucose 4-epimerase
MGSPGRGSELAWVIGATSFLGRHVSRALATGGYRVLGVARQGVPSDIAACWGFDDVAAGPFETSLLERTLARFGNPKVIFHAIGSGSVGQALADPQADAARTLGTLVSLGEALHRLGSKPRLIYPSSAAAYGDRGDGPIAETAPTGPVSVYGRNKLAAEEFCRQWASEDGLEIVILRLFSVFGSPQRKLLFWDLGRRMLAGERDIILGGSGTETRDFIHVTDAARAVALLADASAPPLILNVGSGRAISIATATALLASALHIPAKIGFSGVTRPGDPPHQWANIAGLRMLGFTPQVDLESGIKEYATWLFEAGSGAAG